MRTFGIFLMVLGLVTAGGKIAAQDAEAQVRTILDQAAKALGGWDKLAQYQGVSWKGKGNFQQMNIVLTYEGDSQAQGADRIRHDLVLGDNPNNQFILVFNGPKAWVKTKATMALP